jgi:hypothetical protein
MRVLFLLLLISTSFNTNKSHGEVDMIDSSTRINAIDSSKVYREKSTAWIDKLNGRAYSLPDSIGGKPVSYYLTNSKVAAIAKAFYMGKFRPEDNDSTTQLLQLVTTTDSNIRPFYRWCLDRTIEISDGALGEYPGTPSLKYATTFPAEFFDYMDKDSSGERYKRWTEIIAYSGLNNYQESESEIKESITNSMSRNCNACTEKNKSRIEVFASDIMKIVKFNNQ